MADEEGAQGDFDIFSRSAQTSVNYRGVHHTTDEILEETMNSVTHRITCVGDYAELKSVFDKNRVGKLLDGEDSFVDMTLTNYIIASKSLARTTGGRGRADFIVRGFKRGYIGGIDFETITQDIKYWRQLCREDIPDLTQISLWEQMKNDRATIPLYNTFKYLDSGGAEKEIEEDSPTYALAKMMKRGVQDYYLFSPTLTISYTFPAHPANYSNSYKAGQYLGRVVDNDALTFDGTGGGYNIPLGQESANPSPVEEFISLYSNGQIVCTADQLRGNSDGSFTLVRVFAKYRNIEPEIWDGAADASYGPYDDDMN